MRRLAVTAAALLLAVLVAAGGASAAQLIDRNATGVAISLNLKGEALLTYRTGGAVKHVLVWGAVNALPPTQGAHQVKFHLDYAGGWGKYHTLYWKTFHGSCGTYDGPELPNVVAACKAPDGSYWAAQSWPQPLPDLGYTPWNDAGRAMWLEVSHWTGPVAQLETGMDWVYNGRFQDLFGRYTYQGQPVYGFGTTRYGAPTDGFGTLIYLDTYDSVYGSGWRRENSFVTHNPTGAFCYGFYPFDPTKGGYQHPPGQTATRGPGVGSKYRLFAEGPGVTPDVAAVVPALHPFDPRNPADVAQEQQGAAQLASYRDRSCTAGQAQVSGG
ncbi:MAG TPA: hypothetical protein VMT74_11805 [Gaiellaceae bacterium]|nr:hypothetical protein [Gaiellaceae bacterium]